MKNFIFTLLTLFLFVSFNSYSAKWRVNNTPGIDAHFTSFKQAHDAVAEGDTLMFEGSNLYYGDKDTLSKKLVIVGPGYFLRENDKTNDHILPAMLNMLYVDSDAKGSVIMGMSILAPFDGLQIDADDLIIERNHVNGAIAFCYFNPVKNVVISKNYVSEIDTRWSSETSFATGLIISNNIVKSQISLNRLSTAVITNNCVEGDIRATSSVIKNNISGYLSDYTGSVYQYNLVIHDAPDSPGNVGNVPYADLYAQGDLSEDGEYVLSDSSPAKGAGEGTTDCGAFGGNDPYILSGYPPYPVIFNAVVPSTGTSNLLIKIEARSQK